MKRKLKTKYGMHPLTVTWPPILYTDYGYRNFKNWFDGEFLSKHFNEVMDYLTIEPEQFLKLIDKFRSPHLWAQIDGTWKLRHNVNNEGVDD